MPRWPKPGPPSVTQPVQGSEAQLVQARAFHGQGKLREAEMLFRQIMAARPTLVEPYLALADIVGRSGNHAMAAALLTKATELDPRNAQAFLFLASNRMTVRDFGQARTAVARALSLKPRYPEAFLLSGLVEQEEGNPEAAVEWFRKAVKARKDYAEAHLNLGSTLIALGDVDDAIKHFRKTVSLQPRWPLARFNLALSLFTAGRMMDAKAECQKALDCDSSFYPAMTLIPKILDALEDYPQARDAWEKAVARYPRDAGVANDAGLFMMLEGDVGRSEALARQATTLAPENVGFRKNLIRLLLNTGQVTEAEDAARSWMEQFGEHPEILRSLADIVARDGDFESATPLYLKAWDQRPAEDVIAYSLASTGKMRDGNASGDRILAAYGVRLEDGRLTSDLAYAAGKVWDDRKQWDRAFDAYAKANHLQKMECSFDIDRHEALVDALCRLFQRGYWDAQADLGDPTEVPVLVVGLPRSGTTLTERIIASHPKAAGAGELLHFGRLEKSLRWIVDPTGKTPYPNCVPDITREMVRDFVDSYKAELTRVDGRASRVVDKMPQNFLRLGLFTLLFPHGRIVHCSRDVMDTCVSIFFQNFSRGHAYKNDLEILGRYARSYLTLMDHWRAVLPKPLVEVDYATLVGDQEGESRALISALGLDWDDAVLGFHESKGAVATVSRWQVRQPIYTDSLARWKRYDAHLAPLKRGLGEAS
ncbi:sulfotransferase [Rhodospirillum sp. A1_3_36]|uniref:tetratricopeptide repeat-containing sulfotransferase family protein n=1 Tax=Rhodospirillum sp. A1_3_36 TaxID=3391666 RepID=UPI0039A6D003